MGAKRKLTIDGELLKKEIQRSGMTLRGASENLGYASNYLSEACKSNTISEQAIVLLDKLLGIHAEAYMPRGQRKGFFSKDDIMEELKALHGTQKALLEAVEDLAYAVNLIAKEVKIISYDLTGDEEGD